MSCTDTVQVSDKTYVGSLSLLHAFSSLFSRTTWVSHHQKSKPFQILMKQEMMGGSGISWTICKSFTPHSRHIIMLVPHHSVFTGRMPFLPSNHQSQSTVCHNPLNKSTRTAHCQKADPCRFQMLGICKFLQYSTL